MKIFSNLSKSLKRSAISDDGRNRVQFIFVYFIFTVISLGMLVINYFTGYTFLMQVTAVFAGANLLNMLFSIREGFFEKFARVLFAIEIIALFTCFIITGQPEGFSAIWCALLPIGGMLLYKKKYGSIISATMFVVLVFLFYVPIGKEFVIDNSVYSKAFTLRFPILYVAFYIIGFFFESVIELTRTALLKAKEKTEKLINIDLLTGLGNESSYLAEVDSLEKKIKDKSAKFGIVFMDLNCVKPTNDKYGHRFGCHLIVEAGKTLPSIFKTSGIFHVGGDEFIVLVKGKDYNNIDSILEKFDKTLSYQKITFEEKELTLSVARGFSRYKKGDKYDSVLQRADEAMYKNKLELKKKYNISER